MQITTSYKVKITEYSHIFEETLRIYRDAVCYLIDVVNREWPAIAEIAVAKKQVMLIETLVHATRYRAAVYDFDERFYKFPSYLRRSALAIAIGIVKSYRSNYANWEALGCNGAAPRLQLDHYTYPALYNSNMYERTGVYAARIKIYRNNDWGWLDVSLRKSDVDYLQRHYAGAKQYSPILEKRGRNWYLRFAVSEKVELTNNQNILTAVDLGVNNPAVCVAMLSDGTVIARKFIKLAKDTDRLQHQLNKIKQAQQRGARSTPRLWAYANATNRGIAEKAASEIVAFAVQHNSDVIVFEHLDTAGKKHGSRKQRISLWRKQQVLEIVAHRAHKLGMRISTVCAGGTSKLAFDGSGAVQRDTTNYSMCMFKNGKRYHSDLSAAYNIGARYYIRDILKSLPETIRLAAQAKVPALAKRTTCVLSDLINLHAVLAAQAG